MRVASTILALSLSVFATAAMAQSQPNFGPNAPSVGDSYGKPPSGTMPPMSGARAYAYRSHSYNLFQRHHHRYHRHHHW
jgi:hypothetical protein